MPDFTNTASGVSGAVSETVCQFFQKIIFIFFRKYDIIISEAVLLTKVNRFQKNLIRIFWLKTAFYSFPENFSDFFEKISSFSALKITYI